MVDLLEVHCHSGWFAVRGCHHGGRSGATVEEVSFFHLSFLGWVLVV